VRGRLSPRVLRGITIASGVIIGIFGLVALVGAISS
jgi:hypothetical protein